MTQAKNEIIFHNYQKFYNMVLIFRTTVIRLINCLLAEKNLKLSGISPWLLPFLQKVESWNNPEHLNKF